MSEDREYLRKTAARWVDNENLFDELGEAWAPGSRDAARLAADYLDVLDEKMVDAEILKRVQDDRRYFLEKYRTLQARLTEALDALRQIRDEGNDGGKWQGNLIDRTLADCAAKKESR